MDSARGPTTVARPDSGSIRSSSSGKAFDALVDAAESGAELAVRATDGALGVEARATCEAGQREEEIPELLVDALAVARVDGLFDLVELLAGLGEDP